MILENCPYFDSEQCPQPEAVARAYLVPQILDRAEIEATEQACRTCGRYLDEKRKHSRVGRPFQVILLKGEKTTIEGDAIDISKGGALIQLKDWVDFEEDERVTLKIHHSHEASERRVASEREVPGLIERIETQEQKLAIVFLEELDE